ncbi:MAG: HAD family hydrolase [Armatimonadetes bacterium]|nr:HAD family hydrolase [Armatimonadota bacterium]MDE2205766.1 HAD family hydrolase [Armatimonadota bacterium]
MTIRPIDRLNPPFATLDAVLFDLDNTLIETHIDFPAMKAEVRVVAKQYSVSLPDDGDVLGLVAAGASAVRAERGIAESVRFESAALRTIEEIERRQCAAPVQLAGASDLLRLLRSLGVGVGVVTRNCRAVADALLAAGDLVPDVLLARNDVPAVKPNPDHLLRALEAISHATRRRVDAGNSAMAGDHTMDVRAGRAAGMLTVGFLRGRDAKFFAREMPELLFEGPQAMLEMVLASAPTYV